MITIYKASVAEATQLTELARNIYKEHYLHLWHPGGAEWYMETYAYAFDKIQQELADDNIEYFIAVEKGIECGYLKLVLNAALEGYEKTNALEVERIYLHQKAMGKGLGKQLMQLAAQRAEDLEKDRLFLKAMDSSAAAIEFYQRQGFDICGSLQLPMPAFSLMKAEYRGMLVLKKELRK
jgi:ribosomal protein S18 acetylase RimI-like enzyme